MSHTPSAFFARMTRPRQRTHAAAWLALLCLVVSASPARAHGVTAGALVLDHPYALPSLTGTTGGAAYLRGIRNRGDTADRLVGADTPIAARVELHRMTLDGGVMHMRETPFIALPPHSQTALRHGGEYHLMLIQLKQPLKDGDRFDMTLKFEHAGPRTVTVWVQTPRHTTVNQGHEAHRH